MNVVSDLGVCGTRWMRCLTENVIQGECYVWPRHVWYKWMLCLTQTRVVQGECYVWHRHVWYKVNVVSDRHVWYKVNVMSDTDTCGTRWMLCLTQTRVVQGECYVWPRHVWPYKVNVVPDLDKEYREGASRSWRRTMASTGWSGLQRLWRATCRSCTLQTWKQYPLLHYTYSIITTAGMLAIIQAHSEPRFLASSSKLCQNWFHHWRGSTLYLRPAVHRRCQRPPKNLGTNKTVKAT